MSYSVLVLDMFHCSDPDERHSIVGGFPDEASAAAYARARTWDSVEELRKPGQTHEELRQLWFALGEDALVLGGNYKGADEVDYFIDHPANASQRDWTRLTPSAIAATAG